jgi:hypothetical protein
MAQAQRCTLVPLRSSSYKTAPGSTFRNRSSTTDSATNIGRASASSYNSNSGSSSTSTVRLYKRMKARLAVYRSDKQCYYYAS